MKRIQVSLNEKMAAMLSSLVDSLASSENEVVRIAIRELWERRNGVAPASMSADTGGDRAEEARPRGRPKGGSVAAGKWYDDVMTGTAEEARAALVECGFIPAGPYETLEGDPENPAPPSSLMELQAKVLVHEIKVHPERSGELLYVQRTRTLRSKKDGDWDEATRIVTSTRAELWGLAKEAATLAAKAS